MSIISNISNISKIPNTLNDDLSFPSICIPHVKMYIGKGCDAPMTRSFIHSAFSRYGDISEVVMIIHSAEISRHPAMSDRVNDGGGDGVRQYKNDGFTRVEEYYRVFIHFNRWHIENGEARYVRSVLMSNSPNANIKLSYGGPWYWKFSANRSQHHQQNQQHQQYRHCSHQPKLRLQLE